MQTQCSGLDYRIGLYFHDYRMITIVFDQLDDNDRNNDDEVERQKAIEKELDCKFIRINPDEENFNIFKAINKIHKHIKNSSKISLIDKISRILLELEFKSNHSIITKALKRVVKKNIAIIIKHEMKKKKKNNIGSKEKYTAYCLRCRDYTGNISPKK